MSKLVTAQGWYTISAEVVIIQLLIIRQGYDPIIYNNLKMIQYMFCNLFA